MSDVTDSRISAAEEYLEGRFVDLGSPGLAAGIMHEGELVWARGFGVADLAAGNRPSEKTITRVASITKTFTATAIMQLRDRGLLGLDDPLTAHLPEFCRVLETGGRVADVTLRRMLTHYSGLSTETALLSWGAEEFPGLAEVLGALPQTEVAIAADSQWKYSNLAFGLLGEVVSRLSGVDYASYVRENVIEPLGMESTGFEREDLPAEHLYTGYDAVIPGDPSRSELRVAEYRHLNGIVAAGQLHSTVKDLARWISFQCGGGGDEAHENVVLDGRTLAEMHRPQYAASDWSSGQCLGWAAERVGERVYHGHGGGIHGFASHISFNIPARTGVVILANVWPNVAAYTLGKEVMEVLLTGSPPPAAPSAETELPAAEPAPGHLAPYTGYFVAYPGIPAAVDFRGGELWITAAAGEGLALHAPSPMQETGEQSGNFILRAGRGAGERAVFDPGRQSFTLGGWLYRRVST